VACALVDVLDAAVLLDPEQLGFVLREILPVPTGDFQDLPEWRALWVRAAQTLTEHAPRTVVMPMSVLRRDYVEEVVAGLQAIGTPLQHILIDVSETALRDRIDHDGEQPPGTRRWRTAQLTRFLDARDWLDAAADLTIASDDLPANQVALRIAAHLASSVAPS
jgi:hypothetical protein